MQSHEQPRPLPRGIIARFFRGASYPLNAFSFIRRHGLWRWAVAPAVVNTVLLGGLLAVTLTFVIPLIQQGATGLAQWAGDSTFLGIVAGVGSALLWTVGIAVVVLLNVLLLLLLGQTLASPFLDIISERVENVILGTPGEPFSIPRTVTAIRMSVVDLVWTIVYWAGANAPLALLGMIVPPITTWISTVLGLAFSAMLLAQEFVGLAWARQLIPFRQRWRMLRRNTTVALGFGSACMLLVAVPGVNLVLLPLAAVGGTMLNCDLQAAEQARRASSAQS